MNIESNIINILRDFHKKKPINDIIIVRIINKIFKHQIGYNFFESEKEKLKLYYYIMDDIKIYPYMIFNKDREFLIIDDINIDEVSNIGYDIFFNKILDTYYIYNINIDNIYIHLENVLKKLIVDENEIDYDYIPNQYKKNKSKLCSNPLPMSKGSYK